MVSLHFVGGHLTSALAGMANRSMHTFLLNMDTLLQNSFQLHISMI